MNVPVGVSAIGVGEGECLRLESPKDLQLRARRGTVWITVDGDPRDFVLEPGQSLMIERDAPALVSALHGTAVIEALRLPQATTHRSWRRAMMAAAWAAARGRATGSGRELSRRFERAHRIATGIA